MGLWVPNRHVRKPSWPRLERSHPLAQALRIDIPFAVAADSFSDIVTGAIFDIGGTNWQFRDDPVQGQYLALNSEASPDASVDLLAHQEYYGDVALLWQGSNGGFWAYQIIARMTSGQDGADILFSEESDSSVARNRLLPAADDTANVLIRADSGGLSNVNSTGAIATGDWVDIVLTYDSTLTNELSIYIDGEFDSEHNISAATTFTCDFTNLGEDASTTGTELTCDISLFRAWHVALTAEQVRTLHSNPWQIYLADPTFIPVTAATPPSPNTFLRRMEHTPAPNPLLRR